MKRPKLKDVTTSEPPGAEIGRRIRAKRLGKGWTQRQLAEKSGLFLTTINRLENGPKDYRYGGRQPYLSSIRRIAQALGVSSEELMPDDYF